MNRLRKLLWLFALLGLGLAPGCVSRDLLPDDFARAGVAWSGPPLPLRIGVGEIRLKAGLKPAFLANVVRRSLQTVLDRSRIVAEVRAVDDVPVADLDYILTGELRAFDLYTDFSWIGLYGAFLCAPIPGTGVGAVIMFFAGFPIFTDCAELVLEVDARDARTGRRVGTYRCDFDEVQVNSIYGGPDVNQSYIAHPELLMQHACGRIAHAIGRDRFWLLQNKNR